MFFLQQIACDIDFNDSEAHAGTSFLPFIGFMCFFAGLMLIFIGVIKISNSKHQWNIFYDNRDRKDLKSEYFVRDRKTGIIMAIIGLILFIGSFFII